MTIVCTTNEQKNEHIKAYFDKHNIKYIDRSLKTGDYCFMIPKNEELGFEKDTYFTLLDFDSYKEAHNRIDAAYRDEQHWARTAMLQTASAGKFSSDRTIEEYVKDIWHLEKVKVEL